jgi:C_GCAxxG_C_C family probable redox protein
LESAVACFNKGLTCSQAILSTYGDEFGLDRELALKLSCAFGGGMACMAETCGAVTGAFMVIGLKYGRTRVKDLRKRDKSYELAREFVSQFKTRHGSIICRELLGLDIGTPEGMRLAKERRLFTETCPNYVRDAAEIIENIL